MDITADAVFLTAHHKRDFAVGFQAHQAVNYVAARLFQLSRPYDIVFLVKTRLQLHKHGNLLSVFRRLGQRRNDGRIAADAVQCLLDGQHLRIPGGFPDELHHRGKGLEGMVQQNVSLPDFIKKRTLFHKFRHRLGHILFFLQMLKALQAVHFHKEGKIQGAVDMVNILFLNGKLILDDAQQAFIHAGFHLQTDCLPPLPLFQLFFDFLQQILRLVLINGQIRISHDTERMGAHHVIVEKKPGNIPLNHLF